MPTDQLSRKVEILMGQSPAGETCNTQGIGIPLLNGPTEFGSRYPRPVQYTTDPKKLAHRGDLLFCVRGSTTGRMNWADQTYAIGRGVAALRHRDDSRLQSYVRAVIESSLPSLLIQATGSTFPNISGSQLGTMPFPVLGSDDELAISLLVGGLDDKIELNRRMSRTLEEIARTLFTSWFVRFDPVRAKADGRQPEGMDADTAALFPDAFVDSALGPIPAGWEWSTIGEEVDVMMGQSPPGSTYNQDSVGLPFYQGRADFGDRFPSRRVYCSAPTRFANAGDTLMSVRAPVGDINIASERCAIGRGVAALRHHSSSVTYTYEMMKQLRAKLLQFDAEGTVFGSINGNDLRKLAVILPDMRIVDAFDRICASTSDLIENSFRETHTLIEIRDALLPKLLSGQLRVPEAERTLAEVGV